MSLVVGIREKEGDSDILICLSRSSPRYPGSSVMVGIAIAPPGPRVSRSDLVDYGREVRDRLKSQPAIATALTVAFAASNATPGSVRFAIETPRGEDIPWEAICDDQNQLIGVDRDFRLARVVETYAPSTRVYDLPLRIAAFMSAAGITAQRELDAMLDAIAQSGLKSDTLTADIYLGETGVIEAARARVAQEPLLGGVQIHTLPPDEAAFAQALEQRPAQIIHFFCHGRLNASIQALEFATIAGWQSQGLDDGELRAPGAEADASVSSNPQDALFLQVNKLPSMLGVKQAWAIVLNCCEGATATARVHSMARNLVADGVPACLGMAEPIASSEASLISAAVYSALFKALAPVFQRPVNAAPLDVDFDGAGVAARLALSGFYGPTSRDYSRWLLPRLYINADGLLAQRVSGGADAASKMQIRLQTVADFERNLVNPPQQTLRELVDYLNEAPAVPDAVRPERLKSSSDPGPGGAGGVVGGGDG